jgi:hypothetical protein
MRIEHRHFSDAAFKRINEKYSLEDDALMIIQRILTFGSKEDIQLLRSYYGDVRIREELVNVPYLNSITLSFVAVVFEMQKEAFRFYRNLNEKQLKVYRKRPQFLWPGEDIDEVCCDHFENYFSSTELPDLI